MIISRLSSTDELILDSTCAPGRQQLMLKVPLLQAAEMAAADAADAQCFIIIMASHSLDQLGKQAAGQVSRQTLINFSTLCLSVEAA